MAAGLLVNLRLVPLGFAVGDLLGGWWWRRAVGAHLVVDETVAFATAAPAQRDAERRRAAYWACGTGLFVCWNVGVLLGALGGTVVRARLELSATVERLAAVAVAVVFSALVATAALLQEDGFAGPARPAGVAVAGLLAWRRAPFVVVLAAAATCAVLRSLGVP